MAFLHTLYKNGAIRNADGKLVGFYDEAAGTVEIDGQTQTFRVVDGEHALDLVSRYGK